MDSVEPGAAIDTQLYLDALKGTLIELWESVIDCSETHQDVLATFENGVKQAAEIGHVSSGQLAAFREALNDLGQPMLVRTNADVVRSEFMRQGFTPLSFADDLDIA